MRRALPKAPISSTSSYYQPAYADGSTDRTLRLIVVLDAALKINNAYYF